VPEVNRLPMKASKGRKRRKNRRNDSAESAARSATEYPHPKNTKGTLDVQWLGSNPYL
jgi:hypothetical protein